MADPIHPNSPQGDDRHQSVDLESHPLPAPVVQAQDSGIAPQSTSPQSESPQPASECMYVKGCTTGAQLRKIISHLFGRNKLCTKAIPDHIWVHWCRKHYQRCRYRDGIVYAQKQIEMVIKQIQRVQDWSDDNVKYKRAGDGVLRHWTLHARKREAKRLQSASRKRQWDHNNSTDVDDDQEDSSTMTAIPDWLQTKLNQRYDTPQMLEIAKNIKTRMDLREITQMPDFEILPEIITDTKKTHAMKSKGRQAGSGHGHSKSEIATSTGSFSQDFKRARTGSSSFSMQNMQLSPPYRANGTFASNAQIQARTNVWGPTVLSNNASNNIILPTPVTQRQVSPINFGQQSLFPQGHPNTSSGQQSFQSQGRSHARSMSENLVAQRIGYHYRNQAPQQSRNHQHQQDVFPNYNFTTGYGQGATNQGYSTNNNGNGYTYARHANDFDANGFTFGPTGLNSSTNTPSLEQNPVQQLSNSMPAMLPIRNTNAPRRHVPSYFEYRRANPLVSSPSRPNNAPYQSLGQQSTAQEDDMNPVEPPQHPGTQYGGGYGYSQRPGPRY